ncbi:MAG: BatD family protein [Flavobacterium sp.]|nr:BatD family protein [Flavobacterium sp.]
MKLNRNFNNIIQINTTLSHRAKSRCLIILFFLINTFSFSQSITSTVDSTAIKIGSQFNLTIKANVKPTDKVSFPEGQTFGALEILESYPVDTVKIKDKYELIKKYGLTQFDSGRYVLPQLVVVINDKTIKTDSFPIVVNNVVVDTTKQQMYDIKDIVKVEEPVSYWWLWAILILLGIAATGFGLYYFIKKRQIIKNEKEAILFASPIEKALAKLQSLEKRELWQHGETKAYYSELTDITRTYIEEAVDVPAMESTSAELYEALVIAVRNKNIKLSRETLDQFKKVMSNADLVKFAKSKPLDFEIENDKKVIDTFLISLDKAIPRSEEETQNLFAEELKRKKDRKQKLQRILIPLTAVVMLLGIVGVFFIVTKGTEFVRDNIIGHSSKSLLESEWVTSDYGDPAISISTPKVLKRFVDEKIQNNLPSNIKSVSDFRYGSLTDNIAITLETVKLNDTIKIDLDIALEARLKGMESLGAKNITVQVDDYEDPKGLTGKKAFGTFTGVNLITKESVEMQYQLLIFAQNGGAQELMLAFKKDDEYASQIMDRIIQSIELKKAIPNE